MASSLADSLSSDDDSIPAYSVIYGEDVPELSDSESEDGEDVVRLSRAPFVPPLAASPSPPPILDNRVFLNLTNVEFQDCKLMVAVYVHKKYNAKRIRSLSLHFLMCHPILVLHSKLT